MNNKKLNLTPLKILAIVKNLNVLSFIAIVLHMDKAAAQNVIAKTALILKAISKEHLLLKLSLKEIRLLLSLK